MFALDYKTSTFTVEIRLIFRLSFYNSNDRRILKYAKKDKKTFVRYAYLLNPAWLYMISKAKAPKHDETVPAGLFTRLWTNGLKLNLK